jgi:hypothetical protein
VDGFVGIAESFLGQPNIAGAVFNQKNFYGHTISSDDLHDFLSLSAEAKRNAEPSRGQASACLPPQARREC